MHKLLHKLSTVCILLCCGFVFTGCNDNDDPKLSMDVPSLPTEKYDADAVKYNVTSPGSEITSIELTGAGEYIVVTDSWSPYNAPTFKTKTPLSRTTLTSRASSGGIIFGKFIKISDTEYILEGFGTIVIEGSTGDAISIQVTTLDGESTTISTVPVSENPNSPLTVALCRTWLIDEVGCRVAVNGKVVYDGRKPAKQVWVMMNEVEVAMAKYFNSMIDDPDDYYEPDEVDTTLPTPEKILFSRSATYMVSYTDDLAALATWRWLNEDKHLIHFSWLYDDPYSDVAGLSGQALVTFDGEKLLVVEENSDSDEGLTLSGTTTYYCSMSK